MRKPLGYPGGATSPHPPKAPNSYIFRNKGVSGVGPPPPTRLAPLWEILGLPLKNNWHQVKTSSIAKIPSAATIQLQSETRLVKDHYNVFQINERETTGCIMDENRHDVFVREYSFNWSTQTVYLFTGIYWYSLNQKLSLGVFFQIFSYKMF